MEEASCLGSACVSLALRPTTLLTGVQLPAPQFPLVYASCYRFIALYWDCYLVFWFWSLLLGAEMAKQWRFALLQQPFPPWLLAASEAKS